MRRSIVEARGLALAFGSAAPTTDPYETRPIPEGASFQDKGAFHSEISCCMMSLLASDADYERRRSASPSSSPMAPTSNNAVRFPASQLGRET
jgi:hypothetical protein